MISAISSERGITLIELFLGVLILGMVTTVTFNFYQAQHELYLAQTDVADRQGNLRFATDDISRNIRNAGYAVSGPQSVRVATTLDTLEVYKGVGAGAVDTIKYYVDHVQSPPRLVKKINKTAATDLAHGIDSAYFVAIGVGTVERVSYVLVSALQDQYENTALETRRRLGETINIRNK